MGEGVGLGATDAVVALPAGVAGNSGLPTLSLNAQLVLFSQPHSLPALSLDTQFCTEPLQLGAVSQFKAVWFRKYADATAPAAAVPPVPYTGLPSAVLNTQLTDLLESQPHSLPWPSLNAEVSVEGQVGALSQVKAAEDAVDKLLPPTSCPTQYLYCSESLAYTSHWPTTVWPGPALETVWPTAVAGCFSATAWERVSLTALPPPDASAMDEAIAVAWLCSRRVEGPAALVHCKMAPKASSTANDFIPRLLGCLMMIEPSPQGLCFWVIDRVL